MTDTVTIRAAGDGIWVIAPEGAPTVLDGAAGIDVTVLEVHGGHLSWSVLAAEPIPAAVIDDLDAAQEWIWAIYGEPVALAIADFGSAAIALTADPKLPQLAADVWRLGFAQWAARWWPASSIDAIATLDEHLLAEEIVTLTEACELLVDDDGLVTSEEATAAELPARAEDYALAAGPGANATQGALVLGQGTCGWDWRGCPPGLIDASERAVSWELVRESGATTIRVHVVAAPQLGADVPPHLRPLALISTPAGVVTAELNLEGDTWQASAHCTAEAVLAVDIHVPGIGARAATGLGGAGIQQGSIGALRADDIGGANIRQRIRELAAARLANATSTLSVAFEAPLLSEIVAAANDSDF
ncbi:hypothetical protein [Nocardia australiensis]|uniref:hypothetical protein n=1 Tax=Nocardia australiensis TaxID=2887191 RepID=UPI001D1513A4|nr:hypothetical protein [Nocardia australiensis]